MTVHTDVPARERGQTDAPAPERVSHAGEEEKRRKARYPGRQTWAAWPAYDAAGLGFRGYWYPVAWSSNVAAGRPVRITLCGENIVLVRDSKGLHALYDRCPHRGVPLSTGTQEFDGSISCPYHGWTFDTSTGRLGAVITDGPDSPICGKVSVATYPVEELLNLVWVYTGVDGEEPTPLLDQIPEELRGVSFNLGGRIKVRRGDWRLTCENGFDEGHAKFLHRNAMWRRFKSMPVWNVTKLEQRGRWLFRVQTEQHWTAEFPGYGSWPPERESRWRIKPSADGTQSISNTGNPKAPHPHIAAQDYPGFVSVSMPGVLRVVYPDFIHYEFYVPYDADHHRYVGLMVNFDSGFRSLLFKAKYLGFVRWFFHGLFAAQDAWMVDETDAPPERLYRPDVSLTTWRSMCEDAAEERTARLNPTA